jgi:hypothetical protein
MRRHSAVGDFSDNLREDSDTTVTGRLDKNRRMHPAGFSETQIGLLFVELDFGQTFVRMALTAPDPWLAERNLSHAQAAHDAVERFQDQLLLSAETRDKLLFELGSLRNAIAVARAV